MLYRETWKVDNMYIYWVFFRHNFDNIVCVSDTLIILCVCLDFDNIMCVFGQFDNIMCVLDFDNI